MDSYRPGRKVPSRKLVASLSEDNLTDRVPKRSYMATLIGAREPDNKMVIVLDPFDPTAMQLLSNTEGTGIYSMQCLEILTYSM